MQVIIDHPMGWAAKTVKNVGPLSEGFAKMMMLGFQKCSSLALVFDNREKGKIDS